MRFAEFLLLLLVGWTAVGIVGITISFLRQENAKALRNFCWVLGVWAIYLVVLVATSLLQKPRLIAAGGAQCFEKLCYTVVGVEELPGYLARRSRLVRVKLSLRNDGKETDSEPRLFSYLIDQHGRRWNEVPGLSGVALSSPVPAGKTLLSEPVFKLPDDAAPMGIVLTRGPVQFRSLAIGDRDSLLHAPTITLLGR